MATRVKTPRRTAERIVETALELFNRFGEPNVSTNVIAAELGISAGNLHYHYPAKDRLVDTLFDRFETSLSPLLDAAEGVRDVEDAWLFFHMLFERVWAYRFIYRDLNDLISHNRHIETRFQVVLARKSTAVRQLLDRLGPTRPMALGEAETVATAMVVVATYWLSYEYVKDPRHALEPANASAAMLRGASHALSLLLPYLEPAQQRHLAALSRAYVAPAQAGTTVPATSMG